MPSDPKKLVSSITLKFETYATMISLYRLIEMAISEYSSIEFNTSKSL